MDPRYFTGAVGRPALLAQRRAAARPWVGCGRSKGTPILFDLLTSLWENSFINGQSAARRSVRVAKHRLYDSLSCRLADLVSGRGLDLIGIGAQRSGTSWLYACVHDHPQICMPRKETNFFTLEQRSQRRLPGWRR
jgi:hypothetical protein